MTTFKTNGKSLVVTIDGEEYANLERVAEAMNRTSWADDDNTAESVFRSFVWLQEELDSPELVAENILAGIATDKENLGSAPEPLHSQRIAELQKSFEDAGILQR